MSSDMEPVLRGDALKTSELGQMSTRNEAFPKLRWYVSCKQG